MDSPVVYNQLTGGSKCKADHLIRLLAEVQEEVARYPKGVTFRRIPRTQNGVADALAKAGALVSKEASV
jgi:Reverse transcriptase-like